MVPTFLPTGGSRRISASASDRAGSGGKRRSHMGLQITHVWYITTTLIIQQLSDSRQEFFKKQNNNKNNKINILRPLYNSYYLQILLLFFLYSPPLLSFFFRLRTQLIAGSLISLFFYYSPLFLWWKNDIKSYILPLSFIITNPLFIDIDPPTINCFYMKKPVSSHNIIIAILVILSYKNKTKRKKHTWRKKLWWQLFHTWIKQQKWFYYLHLSIIFY